MTPKSLLDTESNGPDDDLSSSRAKATIMHELVTAVEVIRSNYTKKEELAILNGKLDVLASNLQNCATRADLSDAVHQLTWRMAGFAVLLISAMAAVARYL